MVCLCVCVCVLCPAYADVCVCMYIYGYVCMYAYVCICMYMYACACGTCSLYNVSSKNVMSAPTFHIILAFSNVFEIFHNVLFFSVSLKQQHVVLKKMQARPTIYIYVYVYRYIHIYISQALRDLIGNLKEPCLRKRLKPIYDVPGLGLFSDKEPYNTGLFCGKQPCNIGGGEGCTSQQSIWGVRSNPHVV